MNSFGSQNSSGSTPPEMPRYTFCTTVSLPSLTMVELMQCNVVVSAKVCCGVFLGFRVRAQARVRAPVRVRVKDWG